jgi:hypothetical protein
LQLALEATTPKTTTKMKLTGMLSFKPCVRTTPITRTVYINALAGAGGLSSTPIPPFAKNVRILRRDSTNAMIIVLVRYTAQDIVTFARAASAQETAMDPIPLPGNAAYLQIQNNGALASDVAVIYELAL